MERGGVKEAGERRGDSQEGVNGEKTEREKKKTRTGGRMGCEVREVENEELVTELVGE